jgi:hypothetical protein
MRERNGCGRGIEDVGVGIGNGEVEGRVIGGVGDRLLGCQPL